MSGNKVFVSYILKEPDESIALEIKKHLEAAGKTVFLTTKDIRFAKNGIAQSKAALEACNVFVPLISDYSSMSEMITEEVLAAKVLHDKTGTYIVPVLVDLALPEIINDDVRSILSAFTSVGWTAGKSTIAAEILDTMSKPKTDDDEAADSAASPTTAPRQPQNIPLPNAPLLPPGGNIGFNANYYITRQGEENFIKTLDFEAAVMRIKGPRQFGKTSLLSRIINYAKQKDYYIIPISFQQFSETAVSNLEPLLKQICAISSRQLRLKNTLPDFWDDYLDAKQNCTYYFLDYLLAETDKPILLAIDEADRVFEYPTTSQEFFGLLRSWYEARTSEPSWNRFNLAISHSTEVYLASQTLNQSPFNVGKERTLEEFTDTEVAELAQKLNVKLTQGELQELMNLVGGHPYLIHVALYSVGSGQYSVSGFVKDAAKDNGPYNDHLRRHLWNLSQNAEYKDIMKRVIKYSECEDTMSCHKLRAAGLIKGAMPRIEPRFKLYEQYFKDKL